MLGPASLRHLNHLFSKQPFHTDNGKIFGLFYIFIYLRPGFAITVGQTFLSLKAKNCIQPYLIELTVDAQ